jgi:spore cortex biosynthesis protein YabQ
MILSMSRQTLLFLSTVGTGAVIGLLYDAFRIFRKTAPHKNAFVQLEDLFFWLAATLFMFYFMLVKNYGEIRFFSILGAAVGMALYFYTVSAVIVKISVAVIKFMKRVTAAALRIILLPVRFLLKLMAPLCIKISRAYKKRLHAAKIYGKMKLKETSRNWFILRKKV